MAVLRPFLGEDSWCFFCYGNGVLCILVLVHGFVFDFEDVKVGEGN